MLRLLAILLLVPTLAFAQGAPKTILVLDGSGSMWGQIDGVNKIVIAREVMGDLLQTLPDELELGLMAYGHRRKGDCSDIELLIEPGTDRAGIADAVNAINPKGKTPLSAAVIAAAEALKYTEEAATVILVSDGIETCDYDPCDVGRKLEETGIAFTAHVIGFDVADPAARAQLQCLAEETGGSFRTADNAEELADALDVVVTEPEPMPVSTVVTFRATDGQGGPEITEGLVWNISTDEAGAIITNDTAATELLDIFPSEGFAEVLRISDEATAEATFTVVDETAMTVTLVLPAFIPDATLMAPDSAPAGSLVAVTWTGPDEENDYITSADADMSGSYWHHYAYTRDTEDGALTVRMPPEPGSYELRYVRREGGNQILTRRVIEVTPLDITFDAPAQVAIGTNAAIGWTGPDYENDYLTVASLDQDDDYYVNYSYLRDGNPLKLLMPPKPGTYEIRYVLGASKHVPARTTIEVVDVMTSVTGPATAAVASEVEVSWQGPGLKNDYVAVSSIADGARAYEEYTYVSDGSPLDLKMPMLPGEYELRYVLGQDRTVLARSTISVTDVTATLEAATTINAGEELTVTWAGPGYSNDYVDVAPVGADSNKYESYTYTQDGSPLQLQMPTEPGEYEIRYILNGSPRRVLATRTVTVEAVGATLDAPTTVPSSSIQEVAFTGPAYPRDYISIAEIGAEDNHYEAYASIDDGSPVDLQMPTEPGTYEVRYITRGTETKILATQQIVVEPVTATISGPDAALAGSEIVVNWTGPAYPRDMITIVAPDGDLHHYDDYEYARDGSPLRLTMPGTPGSYELRYVVRGTEHAILATQAIEATPVSATLEAAATAAPGANLIVTWTGPDYRGDYIAISLLGDKGHETYTSTSDGSPLIVKVPDRAGDYELRYITKQDRFVVARQPLTVQ